MTSYQAILNDILHTFSQEIKLRKGLFIQM